ncbi:hypothetical protein HPB47_005856 [Ixodes persulcatus]|uniref:Uncharacterized protein n=1 Tax=Ixodes persulcatus TaxID=34615 RepID=A0AC60PCY7_IXOPE|nr:hypothetical protein HPB47_005856 [Ixodes persulcatus]
MVDALKREVFSVAVDGSNDSHSQLYPIVVTYYAEESGLIESRLLCLRTLEGQGSGRNIGSLILEALASFHCVLEACTADGIVEAIKHILKEFKRDQCNMVGIGTDNASVMTGVNNGVYQKLKAEQIRQRLPDNTEVLSNVAQLSVEKALSALKPSLIPLLEAMGVEGPDIQEIESQWRAITCVTWSKMDSTEAFWCEKFKLLDVNMVSDSDDSGTDFMIVDLNIINSFLGLMNCPECGAKTVT